MTPAQQLIADILSGALVEAAAITERIAALDDAGLAEYEELANAAFDSVRAGEQEIEGSQVEVLTRIADSIVSTQAEAGVRYEAAAADQAAIDALEARIRPVASDAPPADPEADPAAEPEAEPAADPEADPAAEPAEPAEPVAEPAEPQAVAASGRVANPSIAALVHRAAARPTPQPAPTGRPSTQGVLVAAGGDRQYTAGQEMPRAELPTAILQRADALRRSGSRGRDSYLPVASIVASYPEEQRLGQDAVSNTALIAAAVDNQPYVSALTAAGGPCAPPVTLFDQTNLAEATRVFGTDLPTFEATRAGVQVIPNPDWTAYADGVSIWTQAMDIAAADDPDIVKPCVRVDCDEPVTYKTYAIPMCLTVGNWFQKAFPERLAAIESGMRAWSAMVADVALIDAIGLLAVDHASVQALGTTRDVLAYIDERVSVWRGVANVSDNYRLDIWLPRQLRDMIRADLVRALAASGSPLETSLAIANAAIDSLIQARNLTVHWYWYGETGAGQDYVGGAITDSWPAEIIGYLWHPGAIVRLDEGRLDLGVQRSPDLNAQNDLQIWSEVFEGIAYRGVQPPLRLTMPVCANGLQSGTADVSDLVCTAS